ncbi:hypothetical protein BDV26DRAFT_251744 [Aspergillus bertholletiae]|uniref:Uncharacterized protein n=1 Tax=Aspergillus bertholletiae TaxID=1226010 RepID=A0A5N7BP82_9EURO|nr:hypothetical protein BDV26DRAFT_251744 [Aspergillus bertholletiae]
MSLPFNQSVFVGVLHDGNEVMVGEITSVSMVHFLLPLFSLVNIWLLSTSAPTIWERG